MSNTYVTECLNCCSGLQGCPTFSGCVGFPRLYNMLASGFANADPFGFPCSLQLSGLNGNWPLTLPAPLGGALCSWINSGSVADTDPTWLLAFFSDRSLNCGGATEFSGGVFASGAFRLRAINPFFPATYIVYMSSGCWLSGAWDCSGPNTLYADGSAYATNDNQWAAFQCSGSNIAPLSLTVFPSFV